jgi:copper(I)-binding protein
MSNAVGHRAIYRAGGGRGNQRARLQRGSLLLLAGVAAACAAPSGPGATGRSGDIVARHAVAWSAADLKAATIGMEFENKGEVTDTLVAVTSPLGSATLHTEVPGQGMRPLPAVPLLRRSTLRFGRGLHIMVEGMARVPRAGDTIPITLRLARGGAIELVVPVLRYSEAMTALGE